MNNLLKKLIAGYRKFLVLQACTYFKTYILFLNHKQIQKIIYFMTDFIFPNDILTESTVFWCWSTEISLKLKYDAKDSDEKHIFLTITFVFR